MSRDVRRLVGVFVLVFVVGIVAAVASPALDLSDMEQSLPIDVGLGILFVVSLPAFVGSQVLVLWRPGSRTEDAGGEAAPLRVVWMVTRVAIFAAVAVYTFAAAGP